MQTTQGNPRHWCHNIVRDVVRSHVGDPDSCGCWDEFNAEQQRRWDALDASVPCSHAIPGTCDYCGAER